MATGHRQVLLKLAQIAGCLQSPIRLQVASGLHIRISSCLPSLASFTSASSNGHTTPVLVTDRFQQPASYASCFQTLAINTAARPHPASNHQGEVVPGLQLASDGDGRAVEVSPTPAATAGTSQSAATGTAAPHESIPEAAAAAAFDQPEDDRDHAEHDGHRERVLEAALDHVKQYGWTHAALVAGAKDVGLSPAAAAMVARGEAELVEYFVDRCNAELTLQLEDMAEERAQMRVHERVRKAVQMRLTMIIPYIDSWPQALSIRAQPANLGLAVRQVAALADDIWHAAGDTATDYNWYTKRALLSSVYTATELYMLTDYSPGYADTWAALDRRLQDVRQLGKAAQEMRTAAGGMASTLQSFASWFQDQLTAQQQPGRDRGPGHQ